MVEEARKRTDATQDKPHAGASHRGAERPHGKPQPSDGASRQPADPKGENPHAPHHEPGHDPNDKASESP